jgi:hypothetical protein
MADDIEPPYPLIRERRGARAADRGELSMLLARATSFPSDDPRDPADLAAGALAWLGGARRIAWELR